MGDVAAELTEQVFVKVALEAFTAVLKTTAELSKRLLDIAV